MHSVSCPLFKGSIHLLCLMMHIAGSREQARQYLTVCMSGKLLWRKPLGISKESLQIMVAKNGWTS